jgi:hypothetical protein
MVCRCASRGHWRPSVTGLRRSRSCAPSNQGAVSREHAAQAIGWLSTEVAVHGAPSLGPEWLELWERALTATGGQ